MWALGSYSNGCDFVWHSYVASTETETLEQEVCELARYKAVVSRALCIAGFALLYTVGYARI